MLPDDDLMSFYDEPIEPDDKQAVNIDKEVKPWNILIVDDEEDIHKITQIVLSSFLFDGRPLKFFNAYSGTESMELLDTHSDIAVILLDVVMETPESGLKVVKYIREKLKNKSTRIILRTGQPGSAPEEKVISEYDINDYKEKSELTKQKLFTTVTTAIRSYRDITSLENSREELHKIIVAGARIFHLQSMKDFSQAVLQQLSYLLNLDNSAIQLQANGFAATYTEDDFIILAAIGKSFEQKNHSNHNQIPQELLPEIQAVIESKKSQYRKKWYIDFYETESNIKNIICIENNKPMDDMILDLIQVFNMDVAIAVENFYINKEIMDTKNELIFSLGEMIESRSLESSFHIIRVSQYVQFLARELGIGSNEIKILKIATVLHDIGNLGIPDSILKKKEKLSEEESEMIKTHTTIGYQLLKSSDRTIFLKAAEICLNHHERWDGKGYPKGLKGTEIPIAARITSIAEVFDTLSMNKVYRKAWDRQKVFDYIQSESGKSFDPEIVTLFLKNKNEILEIQKENQ
ncbi:MAG: DUF3369 domain-containing protein [Spirochaetaceae bacterium]|nr:DUF3369 domain-containing protein [Spirochaetaceae bacterium]